MASVDSMIERAKRLSARDRRKLVRALDSRNKPAGRTSARGRRAQTPYASLLELAGVGHANSADVASDKYRHLGAAYSDTPDE